MLNNGAKSRWHIGNCRPTNTVAFPELAKKSRPILKLYSDDFGTLYTCRDAVCVCVWFFSCPFDYIKVYDGPDNEAAEIDTYCGSISEDVTIYSSGSSLNVVFETKSGRAEATKKTYITYDEKQETQVQRRGFLAVFNISNSFVNLGITMSLSPLYA